MRPPPPAGRLAPNAGYPAAIRADALCAVGVWTGRAGWQRKPPGGPPARVPRRTAGRTLPPRVARRGHDPAADAVGRRRAAAVRILRGVREPRDVLLR